MYEIDIFAYHDPQILISSEPLLVHIPYGLISLPPACLDVARGDIYRSARVSKSEPPKLLEECSVEDAALLAEFAGDRAENE
jgi:hypothetical protein